MGNEEDKRNSNLINTQYSTNTYLNKTTIESSKILPKKNLINKNKNDNKIINIDNIILQDTDPLDLPEIRRYAFVKELGEGAFGKVHLYKEKNDPKNLIAVKVFDGINKDNIPKNIKKEKTKK